MKAFNFVAAPLFASVFMCSCNRIGNEKIRVYEVKEIVLKAKEQYHNPYTNP